MPQQKPKPIESVGVFASAEKRAAIVCLLLAVVSLGLYNPVNSHPFANFDDDRYVTENPHVLQGLSPDTIRWAIGTTEVDNWQPLTLMSHALDYSLFHLNPRGHHFTSVLLHGLNTVLLFLLLMWATNRFGPSLVVAGLFAVHPINVESVAWISERKNVLCTFFFFLTLWAYGWYTQNPNWKRYLAVFGLFVAGLASKPMVITLPFVLLLLDYWPLNRLRSDRPWVKLVLEKLPLFALCAGIAVITMKAQQAVGAVRSRFEVSFDSRIANAIYSYAMYLWKMVWPARLAPLYPHRGDSLAGWQVLVAAVIVIAITVAVWKFRGHGYALVGWLWFLGMLVPVIGLVQVGEAAMADRYAYIPLIGIFTMLVFGVADWAGSKRLNAHAMVSAVCVLIALTILSVRQIGYWETNEALWSHTLAVTQDNFVAENNLGGALIAEGREEEARPHFEAAARINPHDPMSRSNLGTYFQIHGQFEDAVKQYHEAIDSTSQPVLLASTYANLGAADFALSEDDRAYQDFQQALQNNPSQFNAWLGLGRLARKQGKLDEAIRDFSRSLELRPTSKAFLELGRTLAQSGRDTEALQAYEQALALSPDLEEAQKARDALHQQTR